MNPGVSSRGSPMPKLIVASCAGCSSLRRRSSLTNGYSSPPVSSGWSGAGFTTAALFESADIYSSEVRNRASVSYATPRFAMGQCSSGLWQSSASPGP